MIDRDRSSRWRTALLAAMLRQGGGGGTRFGDDDHAFRAITAA